MSTLVKTNEAAVEFTNILTDTKGMGRQRLATVVVSGLTEANPEISFTPGNLALKRLDAVMIIPIGDYCQAYWNGSQSNPKIHFDLFPDSHTFTVHVMGWGTAA
jgi:hypothetical protein